MTITLRHCFIPVVILLAACGQGENTQAAAPATPEQAPVTASSMTPPQTAVTPATQLAQMDHSMHGGDPMMDMATPGVIKPADSQNGLFKASATSDLDPVVINQLHGWTLHLTTADGAPVEDATITVSGTMPAHAHGMPTNPQVTANLGGGNYKVEGMQFQMGGEWEVTFHVTAGTVTDDIVFHLTLQ